MSRVFMPTYRMNILGVRDTPSGKTSLLSGMGDLDLVVPRAPAEPYPRAVNNPTPPLLGAIFANGGSEMIRVGPISTGGPVLPMPGPIPIYGGRPPIIAQPIILGPISSGPGLPVEAPVSAAPGAPPVMTPPAPPVSVQTSPTPVVTLPPAPAPASVLVSSGGGTAAPATAPVTIQTGSSGFDAITNWLSGSTALLGYDVPNALLAAAVVLGFASLSSGSKGRR